LSDAKNFVCVDIFLFHILRCLEQICIFFLQIVNCRLFLKKFEKKMLKKFVKIRIIISTFLDIIFVLL